MAQWLQRHFASQCKLANEIASAEMLSVTYPRWISIEG